MTKTRGGELKPLSRNSGELKPLIKTSTQTVDESQNTLSETPCIFYSDTWHRHTCPGERQRVLTTVVLPRSLLLRSGGQPIRLTGATSVVRSVTLST